MSQLKAFDPRAVSDLHANNFWFKVSDVTETRTLFQAATNVQDEFERDPELLQSMFTWFVVRILTVHFEP